MEFIVSAEEMKRADRNTIKVYGIPQAVLMEKAALEVVNEIWAVWSAEPASQSRSPRVLVFAGAGGNGGDGIAVARILHCRGIQVLLVAVGEVTGYSDITKDQLEIAMKYSVPMIRLKDAEETEAVRMVTERRFDVIVDALFGIGLNRPLNGVYSAAVALINVLRSMPDDEPVVISIDMPSGINTDTGEVCGIAVKADLTVTMNHRKRGLVLFPGADHAGETVVADAGITAESFMDQPPALMAYNEHPRAVLEPRKADSNKGSFGKLLIVAGNGTIGGAAILCARAAFAAGAGMVRVFTEKNNRTAVLGAVPEALIDTWDESLPVERIQDGLEAALDWSDACVIGPGIGTGDAAYFMLDTVLSYYKKPLVIDADGLNLIASDDRLKNSAAKYGDQEAWPVLTPHVGEFSRLSGLDIAAVKKGLLTEPKKLADELSCTVLCKDARSVTASAGSGVQILNTTGNSGMATAGSGDALAGIAGTLAAQGHDPFDAASRAAYLHGLAGDAAAESIGEYAMSASDIISGLREIVS